MPKAGEIGGGWWRTVVVFLIVLLVAATDQFSKLWIQANLPFQHSLFEIGFFRITHIHNSGAAFGLFQGYPFALAIVSSVGAALLLTYALVVYRRYPFLDNLPNRVAIGLILGGTVGNLIDRLRLGYVIDFIAFNFWPAFNVADSAVTVGAILFACSILFIAGSEKHRAIG